MKLVALVESKQFSRHTSVKKLTATTVTFYSSGKSRPRYHSENRDHLRAVISPIRGYLCPYHSSKLKAVLDCGIYLGAVLDGFSCEANPCNYRRGDQNRCLFFLFCHPNT